LKQRLPWLLGCAAVILFAVWLCRAATPSSIAISAAPFQGSSDRDLAIMRSYLLAQIAGVAATPSVIASNASAFQGMSDKDLLICETYLLSQVASILIPSNTLSSIPTLPIGAAYLFNSNGVLYSINSSPAGVLTTNKLAP